WLSLSRSVLRLLSVSALVSIRYLTFLYSLE
ncbi:unnamed protein product, partial [marine sediment metagenome]